MQKYKKLNQIVEIIKKVALSPYLLELIQITNPQYKIALSDSDKKVFPLPDSYQGFNPKTSLPVNINIGLCNKLLNQKKEVYRKIKITEKLKSFPSEKYSILIDKYLEFTYKILTIVLKGFRFRHLSTIMNPQKLQELKNKYGIDSFFDRNRRLLV